MAKMLEYKEGDTIITQGDADTAAYLIHSGWLKVSRKRANGSICTSTIGPGEIVGELGLAGLTPSRSANVTALTAGELEIIDRGTLIRLVNGPGRNLTPLLAALFARLKHALIDEEVEDELDDTVVIYAKLEGGNELSKQALCNQPRLVTRLPWYFGAHRPPQSVTDLFRDNVQVDVKLSGSVRMLREQHLCLEVAESGGMQLHLMQHGDYCELDGERVGYGKTGTVVPLPQGNHTLCFGEISDPYLFNLHVRI
jgi:hypothetical protein